MFWNLSRDTVKLAKRCKKCGKFCTKKYCSDRCNPNKQDDLSQFRTHLRRAKKRARKKGIKFSITAEDLKYIYEKQQGICPYTGWQFSSKRERRPSLDRIDPSKGYVPGNVQFVSLIAQFAKGDFSEETLIRFCEDVYKNISA